MKIKLFEKIKKKIMSPSKNNNKNNLSKTKVAYMDENGIIHGN